MRNYRKFLVTILGLAGTLVNVNVASGHTLMWIQFGIAVGNSALVYLLPNDPTKPADLELDGSTA